MSTYKIPGTFYMDHLDRFNGEGVWADYDMDTIRWSGRYVNVILTDDQFYDLLGDAEFYAGGAGGLTPEYAGLVKSAQATVKHLIRQERETE